MRTVANSRWWKGALLVVAVLLCCTVAYAPLRAWAEARAAGVDVIIDDTDPRWSYSGGGANNGGWTGGGSGDAASTEHWSNSVGATVDISFEGDGLELYGIKAPNHRFIKVAVDEGDPVEADCYAASRESDQLLVALNGLGKGAHVAHIEVLEKTNPAAVDALGVSLQYAIAKNVELDPDRDITSRVEVGARTDGEELFHWRFDGDWTYGNTHPDLFSAGDEMYSHGKDAKATLYFEGTQVIVGGSLNRAHSTYQFAIDGKVAGTFNAGTASGKHQQVLFTSEKLENRVHELVITNVGETDTIQLDFADVVHKPIKVSGMTLDTDDFALEAGKQRELSYTLLPALADPVPVAWSSSNEDVATVEDGVVTAKEVARKATATITASVEGSDVNASVEVTVYPKVRDFNAFVGDEKLLDLPASAYEDAMTTFADEWSDVAWLGDARASKIGVATRDHQVDGVTIEVGDFTTANGDVIDASNVEVRWLREVIADANRGMSGRKVSYPDVICYPNTGIDIPAETLRFAWVTLNVPVDAAPGVYTGVLTVKAGDVEYPLSYTLEVIGIEQPAPQEVGYSVQLWQHPFSATGYYFGKSTIWGGQGGSGLWGATVGTDAPIDKFLDDDFRQYYKGTLEDYAAMGGDDLVANIVDEAWGHQCYYSDKGMVQWTKTADGWDYDYTLFDRWVEFGIECGVIDPASGRGKIKCYSMIPWNNRVTYTDAATGELVKVDLTPLSKQWQQIWTPFLEDFIAHLEEKGWFDITYIAFDERPAIDGVCKFIKEHKNAAGAALKTAAAINYAPDQVGEDQYLDDISVGQKHVLSSWSMDEWYAFVDARREQGLETTMYTCTGDYPNSSQQADPGDTYWSALYSQALHTDGYLRWALDAWTNDMYGDTTFVNWEPGDAWFIYPLELGVDGVYDPAKLAENPKGYYSSPRYELFKQGIRDVCKARYLEENGTAGQAATVKASFDSMQFPNGSNNVPSSEADRMLAHSESDRVYTELTQVAREYAEDHAAPQVNKAALQAKYDEVKDLAADGYTADSWKAFESALRTAKTVLESDKAGQADVDLALQMLADAHAGLKKEEAPQVDKAALEAAVEEARALKAEDYKTMTWHPFAGALKSAEKVLADAEADQKAVDAAAKALADARAGLKPVEKVAFVDVDEDTSHRAEVEWLAANGVTKGWDNGDGAFEFRPYATVKRADMAAFLYRLAGEPEFDVNKTPAFADVDEKTPHRDAILWLAAEGISTGYKGADGKAEFRPYAEIARCDMAAFLYRMAGEPEFEAKDAFADVARDTPHRGAVLWLAASGVSTGWTAGDGTRTFRPYDRIVRCDMAAFLQRMAEKDLVDLK
ncbi:DUF4091 domain-containing protein [Collinsella sp. BA40]|uniref:glycoside hydrolase domain-containing protein n=1 Tax=Collinsella sp. BA40 TaxID=2560852 RepID=UPI0011C79347|nr:glycoside hydrolase domain-containing protein [Collinsella sp. BA40]TXF35514.1 DUF4091 domain-containing protein [Collinsella sp. BA40]